MVFTGEFAAAAGPGHGSESRRRAQGLEAPDREPLSTGSSD